LIVDASIKIFIAISRDHIGRSIEYDLPPIVISYLRITLDERLS